MNTPALEVFRSDCNLAGHHQMVAKFQQEIFRGRFSSRVFPVLTSTAESLLRHFLEWALETLKHESRFIGPVGSFQNGRIGTQQLQKKDGTDGVTVNLVKSRCSGKDSWNHFLKRVLDMSFSKASVFVWSYLNLVNQYWPSGEFLSNFRDNTRTRFWLAIHHNYRCWISISLSHVSAQKQSVLFCQSHQLFLRRLHDIALLRTW